MIFKNRSFYVLLDIAAILISFLGSLLLWEMIRKARIGTGIWYGGLIILFSYAVTILFYQPKKTLMKRNRWNELETVVQINLTMAVILTFLLYLLKSSTSFPRSFYIVFFIVNAAVMYLLRCVLKETLLGYYRRPENRKRIIFFANEENVLKMMHKYVTSHMFDYEPVAVVAVSGHNDSGNMKITIHQVLRGDNGTYMQTAEEALEEFLIHEPIDEALISMPNSKRADLQTLVHMLEEMGVSTHVTTNTFGLKKKEKMVEDFGIYHVLTYSPRIFEPTELFLKRMLDVVGGLVGCVIAAILGILVGPLIYLESPGPIIFKQTRIGKNGRRFSIYKFRSMYMDAEERKKELMAQNEMDGLMFKIKDDPRITKVGKFIRKTSIDEFPQFFNVLAGDMSLVGTRPPTEDEFMQYSEHHKRRLSLKPGITGMWQVSGRSDITDFEEIVNLDLEYIDNWSIWLDIKLLFQTVYVVLFQRGAS